MAVVGLDTLLGHRWAEARIKLCCRPRPRTAFAMNGNERRDSRSTSGVPTLS